MSQIDVTVKYTSPERCRGKHGGWNSSIAAFFGNFCLYRGGNREGTGQVLFARDAINVSPRATIQFANTSFLIACLQEFARWQLRLLIGF